MPFMWRGEKQQTKNNDSGGHPLNGTTSFQRGYGSPEREYLGAGTPSTGLLYPQHGGEGEPTQSRSVCCHEARSRVEARRSDTPDQRAWQLAV